MINTTPRMMLPVKSSTIPAITRTTAAIHKMKVMSRFMHPAYPRLLRFTPAPARINQRSTTSAPKRCYPDERDEELCWRARRRARRDDYRTSGDDAQPFGLPSSSTGVRTVSRRCWWGKGMAHGKTTRKARRRGHD
jgi:hypothetical protein